LGNLTVSLKDWIVKKAITGKLPNWMYRLAGKKIAKILKLEEGNMAENTETKKWYRSKGVLTGVVTVLIGLYESVRITLAPQFGWTIPNIPEFLYVLLGALGVYSRVVADKKIG
jgi:hypothetical protein